MIIKTMNKDFTVCKVTDYSLVNMDSEYCFTGKTADEKSLVCLTADVPANTTDREDGWRGFYIDGVLDFSLVGILSKISAILADAKIGIFAVSTYNTDYIFVKQTDEMKALSRLAQNGYSISTGNGYGDYFLNRTANDIMDEYSSQSDEWKGTR